MTSTVPHDLLKQLRSTHRDHPDRFDEKAAELGLTPMSGGRQNRVYTWPSSDGPVCLKLYRTDKRDRAGAERNALDLLADHGVPGIPRVLWHDPDPELPALAMTLVPGTPMLETAADPRPALSAMADRLALIRTAPLGPFATLPRVDSADHYIHRIRDLWPTALRRLPTIPEPQSSPISSNDGRPVAMPTYSLRTPAHACPGATATP